MSPHRPEPFEGSLLRSTVTVSAGTAASRGLGFIREILMAFFFGTSLAKSAFDVAFRIPNLFRRLFGEGALAAAFVPVFTECLHKRGLDEANRLAGQVMTMMGAVLGAITLGGMLLIWAVMQQATLGVKAAAVLPLLRIMLPYLFFICLVALCMAILNSLRHFAVPALTPVLLNGVWIVSLLVICPRFGDRPEQRIYGVAWGILAAGCLQLLAQVPVLMRLGVRPRMSFRWGDPVARRVLALMGPAALGMGVHQVNVCISGVLALAVATWAPAALVFAERLIYLPLGVFATALGTVLLPAFSRQAAGERHAQLMATLNRAVRHLALVMTPAAVVLCVLARPVVQLVYAWKGGEFGPESTLLTARAVAFYAPGLIVFGLYKLLVPVFYALQDTRTPVRIAVGAVVLNFALNILFILTWPHGYEHAGLALSTVIASAVNCAALGRVLHRRIGSPGWRRIGNAALRILLASLAMGWMVRMLHGALRRLLGTGAMPGKVSDAAALGGAVLAGLVLYAALAFLLCRGEMAELLGAWKNRHRAKQE